MKKICAALIASAALAYSPAALAADFVPGDANFVILPGSGDPTTGTESVSAFIGNSNLAGSGSDTFTFQIGPVLPPPPSGIGLGSGSVTTEFSFGGTELTFDSVNFWNGLNNYVVPITTFANGARAGLANIPIYSGLVNVLTVNYTATGGSDGSYGGQINYVPGGIPEPTTWAMMLIGFAAVGFALRRRRRDDNVRVRYAF